MGRSDTFKDSGEKTNRAFSLQWKSGEDGKVCGVPMLACRFGFQVCLWALCGCGAVDKC